MYIRIRPSTLLIFSLACLVCFGTIAFYIGSPTLERFDHALTAWIQSMRSPQLTALMKPITALGSLGWIAPLACLALAAACFTPTRRIVLAMFTAMIAGSALLNYGLKLAFRRERPALDPFIEESGFSFPSGHAMQSFAFFAALVFLLWSIVPSRAGRTVLLAAAGGMTGIIGLSRIYLGVHYPSDIAAGYLASAGWLAVCAACCLKLQSSSQPSQPNEKKLRTAS